MRSNLKLYTIASLLKSLRGRGYQRKRSWLEFWKSIENIQKERLLLVWTYSTEESQVHTTLTIIVGSSRVDGAGEAIQSKKTCKRRDSPERSEEAAPDRQEGRQIVARLDAGWIKVKTIYVLDVRKALNTDIYPRSAELIRSISWLRTTHFLRVHCQAVRLPCTTHVLKMINRNYYRYHSCISKNAPISVSVNNYFRSVA